MKPEKFEFSSLDRYEIKGHGTVYVVPNPIETTSFKHLVDVIVDIDGKDYSVKAVEHQAKATPHKVGEPIGLLVKEV